MMDTGSCYWRGYKLHGMATQLLWLATLLILLHATSGASGDHEVGENKLGIKLQCFMCNSLDDLRCGENFTIPRDESIQCYLENHRCRTVTKEPAQEGSEKVFYRDCGAITGVEIKKKDVKGCTRMYYHKTEAHENVCFCNELYCNSATTHTTSLMLLSLIWAVYYFGKCR